MIADPQQPVDPKPVIPHKVWSNPASTPQDWYANDEPTGVPCHACDGDGIIWDESACGDPDHCSPWFMCHVCDGQGVIS